MAKSIFPVAGSSSFTVTSEYDGDFIEFGDATPRDETGCVTIQFNPDVEFDGQFAVVARRKRTPNDSATDAPFLPVAYIAVNVNGAASLRPLSVAVISAPGLIEVPATGLSVGLLVACTAGKCTLYLGRHAGPAVFAS